LKSHKRKGFITLNARSLTDDARIYAALALGNVRGAGVIVFCETKRQNEIGPIPEWNLFQTPANTKGQWGCAVLVHQSLMLGFVRCEVVVPHRVVALEFDRHVIMAVYAPTFMNAEDQENVLNSISHFLKQRGTKRRVIMGDFNARPLKQCRTNRRLRAASHRFTDFLLHNDLVASNVCFPGKGTPFTYKKSTLDYIVVDKRFKSSVKNILTLQAPFKTDHVALMAEIQVKWAKPKKCTKEHRPDVGAIQNHPRRIASLCLLAPHTSLVSALKPNGDFLPLGKNRVRWNSGLPLPTAGEQTFLVQETRPSDIRPLTWLDLLVVPPNLHDFLQSSRHSLLALPAVGNTFLKPTRQKAWKHGLVESLLALQSKMRLPPNIVPDAIDALQHHDATTLVSSFAAHLRKNPRRAWDFIGAFRRKASAVLPAASPQERVEKFHKHFSKLFAPPPEVQAEPFDLDSLLKDAVERTLLDIVWDTGPFRANELDEVAARAKFNRARGLDDVPNELLLLPELRVPLLDLLNEMKTTPASSWPDLAKKSLISTLPKKGDLSDTGNWRGIVLMSHLTKLYDALLMQRLRNAVDRFLKYTQNAFRQDRGTAHHIAVLKILTDIAKTRHDYPLHGCFVDFSKAFDSVFWKGIVRRLQFWNCPDLFIREIFKVMQDHTLYVRTSDGLLSDPITQSVGVLQGDTLAPYLFILVLDGVLQKLPPHLGVLLSRSAPKQTARQKTMNTHGPREKRLTETAFADDIFLVAHCSPNLQQLFSILEHECLLVGLRVNMGPDKTERFCIGDDPGTLVNMHGVPVPLVKFYKYLGSQVLSFDKEFAKRKACAWAAMKSFDAVWESDVKMDLKRSLFRSLIDPIFTYAAHTWSLTRSQMNEVDAAYGRLLRRALGLKPAFLSHSIVHTEKLYGELPFITSVIAERRFKFCAHVYRATALRGDPHPLAFALDFDTSHLRPKVGSQSTFLETLARDARAVFDGLHPMFLNKTRSLQVAMKIRAERQTERYRQIYLHRASHMQSYFDDDPQFDEDTGKRRRRAPRIVHHPDPTVAPGKVRPCASDFQRSVWTHQPLRPLFELPK